VVGVAALALAVARSQTPVTPQPLVSVVIPVYNAAAYIVTAVRSVLAQRGVELELIVVDDGSSDETRDLVHGVSDPRLRLLADTNHGPAHARNQGCRAAGATSYIAFLDADDSWDGEKLLEQIRFLESNPELVGAGCFMRYVSSSGKVLGETGQRLQPADVRRVAAGELFPFPMSSLIVRRSALERSGLFDESFRYAGSEDLDFLARLAAAGPLQCVPRVLGSYRIHPGSAMARERLRINAEARFVRHRIARRAAGGDLTWDEFRATHRRTWAERRQDLVEVFYRSAALWHGEGRRLRAFGYALLATITGPRYTIRRLYRQRVRRHRDLEEPQPGGVEGRLPTRDQAT
jgi:glycosyltransferase involved in cell wall biosynthesis